MAAQNFVPPPLMSQSHKKLINNGRQLGGKSAQAYKKSYSQGPPVIPNAVFTKVLEYVGQLDLVRKAKFVSAVCRYWSLKREARRGAPLLKRLHLEPWTANASMHNHSDEELAKRINLMRLLREDLEKVRMLTEQVRKREQLKLRTVNALKVFVDEFVFAKERKMRTILDDLVKLDKNGFFLEPVSEEFVPGYREVIKNPMDFTTIRTKLDQGEYYAGTAFADDVALIVINAKTFNAATFAVHKHAVRIALAAEPMLAELRALDAADSSAALFEEHMDELLSAEVVEDLFAFDFDPDAVYEEPVASVVEIEEGQAAARYAAAVKAAAEPKVDRWEGKNRPGRKRKSELLAIEEARRNAPPVPRAMPDRLRRVSTIPNTTAGSAATDLATPHKPLSAPTLFVHETPNPHNAFDPTAGPSRAPASVPKEKKPPVQLGEDGKPKRAPREGRMLPRGAACLACRNRKVRCDSIKPQCGPCQKAGNRYGPCDYVWMLRKTDGSQAERASLSDDGLTPRVKKPRPSLDSPATAMGSPLGPSSLSTPDLARTIKLVPPQSSLGKGTPANAAAAAAAAAPSPPPPVQPRSPTAPSTAGLEQGQVSEPPVKRKPGRPPRAAAATPASVAPTQGLTDHDQFNLFNTGYILPEGQTRGSRRRTIANIEPEPALAPADTHHAKKARRESMPNLAQVDEEAAAAPAAAPAPVRVAGRQTRGSTTGQSPALVALPYGERWKPKLKEDEAEAERTEEAKVEADKGGPVALDTAEPTKDEAAVDAGAEDVAMGDVAMEPTPAVDPIPAPPTQDEPLQVDDTPEPQPALQLTPDDADADGQPKEEPDDQPDRLESSQAPETASPPATPSTQGKRGHRNSSASKPSMTAAIKKWEDDLAGLEDQIAVRPKNLEDGTLVWATVKGWPAVPAEYCNPRDKSTPAYVMELRPENWRLDKLQPVSRRVQPGPS